MEMCKMKSGICGSRVVIAVTYIYMVLPFVIFVIGWLRIRYGILVVAAVSLCTWKAWKDTPDFAQGGERLTRNQIVKILFICAVLAAWVFYSGIGGWVFQNGDHYYRNGIFEVLVKNEWPVYNMDIDFGIYPEGTAVTALVYYIGFWMPAAVVGKLLGLSAGYAFQSLWAFVGLLLVYYYMCARKGKLLVWPLALLIFFSGLDVLGLSLTGTRLHDVPCNAHIEWWGSPYQYSSMTTQLFWVFNQSLPAWLCTIFAMQQRNSRSVVFILSTVMLNATFPFAGLLIFLAYWMFSRKYGDCGISMDMGKGRRWAEAFVKDAFSIQNIIGGGSIGIFTYLYLKGNVSASGIAAQGLGDILASVNLPRYIVFVLMEAGVYLVLLYKYNKDNGLYYVTLLSLVCIPLLKGSSGDFCMRVSIPALFILMLLIQDTLEEARKKKDCFVFWGLILALCIGSVTPIHEFTRTVQGTIACQNNGEAFGTVQSERDVLNYRNFSGRADDGLFFGHIAKKPRESAVRP